MYIPRKSSESPSSSDKNLNDGPKFKKKYPSKLNKAVPMQTDRSAATPRKLKSERTNKPSKQKESHKINALPYAPLDSDSSVALEFENFPPKDPYIKFDHIEIQDDANPEIPGNIIAANTKNQETPESLNGSDAWFLNASAQHPISQKPKSAVPIKEHLKKPRKSPPICSPLHFRRRTRTAS
jgi:hypothetical protein